MFGRGSCRLSAGLGLLGARPLAKLVDFKHLKFLNMYREGLYYPSRGGTTGRRHKIQITCPTLEFCKNGFWFF